MRKFPIPFLVRRLGLLLFLIFFLALPLEAASYKFRLRTMVGMEPIGWLNGQYASYGFTPGLAFSYSLTPQIELGLGIEYQVNRRISPAGVFAYYPLYASFRYRFQKKAQRLQLFGELKAGYSFFNPQDTFGSLWDSQPLTQFKGGFYGGLAVGLSISLVQQKKWGMDFAMETGYSAYNGSGSTDSESQYFPLTYHVMQAKFSLDWRF